MLGMEEPLPSNHQCKSQFRLDQNINPMDALHLLQFVTQLKRANLLSEGVMNTH